jgi:hypothetical protein
MSAKADTKKLIRREILDRAEMRCECYGECGSEHSPAGRCHKLHMHAYWDVVCVLTICHVNHDPKDNDRGNLKAYCQHCKSGYEHEHSQHNAAATRERRRLEAERGEMHG